jgi:hypothetical protein
LINNHECDSPNIQIQKLNEIGVTVNLELFCSTCNKKIDWSGSSKIGKTKVLQVNKSVSLAGQFSSISYNEYFRFFAFSGIKPLSEPKFHDNNSIVWKNASNICEKALKSNKNLYITKTLVSYA